MQKEQQQLDKLLAAALIRIVDQQPLYYAILKRIPKFFRSDLTRPCALGVDQNTGRICILLNQQILANVSVIELQVVLEHMLHHILLPHHHQDRMAHGHSFHLACDLIINQNIAEFVNGQNAYGKGKTFAGKLLVPQRLEGLHGFDQFSLARSSVYELWPLLSHEKHLKNLDSYQTIDETDFHIQNFVSITRWVKADPSHSRMLRNQVKTTLVDAMLELQKIKKSPGRMTGHLSKYITDLLEEAQVDYSSLLQKFVGRVNASKATRTWTRTHRKYPNEIRGRTQRSQQRSRILVVVDTSGSMWHDCLMKKVLAELKKIHKLCPDLWVVGGDVQETFRFCLNERPFIPELHELLGGGDTDLQFGFNVGKELEVDGIVVLTDGQIPEFNSYDIPTTFVIVPYGVTVVGHENVFLT